MKNNRVLNQNLNYYEVWERKSAMYTNYWLSMDEKRELLADCGPMGVLVFEYLLFLANQKDQNPGISDEQIAKYFDISPHTAKKQRLSLTRKHWLHTHRQGNISVHILGKEAVQEYLDSREAG